MTADTDYRVWASTSLPTTAVAYVGRVGPDSSKNRAKTSSLKRFSWDSTTYAEEKASDGVPSNTNCPE
ncbi:hypothetical protein MHYP_G00270310 [Metynnis hypsauchen]